MSQDMIDNEVEWTSQAAGSTKTKRGKVIAYVPRGNNAALFLPEEVVKRFGASVEPGPAFKAQAYNFTSARYIVAVPRKSGGMDYYAPPASRVKVVEKGSGFHVPLRQFAAKLKTILEEKMDQPTKGDWEQCRRYLTGEDSTAASTEELLSRIGRHLEAARDDLAIGNREQAQRHLRHLTNYAWMIDWRLDWERQREGKDG